jgi:hypothetical protein
MTDFEDRIRASLHARAQDVEPTPALWDCVQRRVRRRRWVPLPTAVGAGAVAAFVAVTVVVPTVVRDPGPPVIGEAPTEDGAGRIAPVPTLDGRSFVVVDRTRGTVLQLVYGQDGAEADRRVLVQPVEGAEFRPVEVAVHPASTADDLTVVIHSMGEGMDEFHWVRVVDGQVGEVHPFATALRPDLVDAGTWVTPVFTDDGRNLVWVEETPPTGNPASQPDEPFAIRTIGWNDGPTPDGAATFPLTGTGDIAAAVIDAVDVDAGRLTMRVEHADGTFARAGLGVERQGDRALALTGALETEDVVDGAEVSVGRGTADYTIRPDGTVVFATSDGGTRPLDTPDGFVVEQRSGAGLRVRVSPADQGHALLFDDAGRMWLVGPGGSIVVPGDVYGAQDVG